MSTVPRYPLDKNQLGNASWKILHSYAAQYPDNPTTDDKKEFHSLLKAVVRTIPEGDCKCRSHAVSYIQSKNPRMANRKDLVEWLCEFHNDTNKRADKPLVDCNEVVKNTGECKTCKVEKKEEKSLVVADKDGPLKSVMGDYKQLSVRVFDELCKREGLPTPRIVFSPCPPPNDHTSCTIFALDKNKQVIKDKDGNKEPIVYINPSTFGLRVLIHEWHEYQRQMKHEGYHLPHDEDTVERNTREIIHKYFPKDSYNESKHQIVQPLVMKDEMATPEQEEKEKEKPYSFRGRKNYRNSFTTEEFPMFAKYREKEKESALEEASKAESGGMLSYFDPFYEPFAKYMNLTARDLNLANTPNLFAEGSKIAINSQFTSFGSLVATTVAGLAFYLATALNRDGIGIADRRLLAQLGGQFLWSGVQSASSPVIRQTASEVGSYLATMEFDQILKLLLNDNSIFAGLTEAQQQQQVGIGIRSQQRAGGGFGGSSRVGSGSGAASSRSPAQSVIERVQERALNPNANQPSTENLRMFKNFPSGASGYEVGSAVPRTDSGGGHGFSYSPTPSSPYDMPQEEAEYNAMLGMPTEPTDSLPSRNLGMTLTPEELEELR